VEDGFATIEFYIPFPISRDPPEGGTPNIVRGINMSARDGFQFLGIPPKGELLSSYTLEEVIHHVGFQFLGIPPKGEHPDEYLFCCVLREVTFPISRDPPEGGTVGEAVGGVE